MLPAFLEEDETADAHRQHCVVMRHADRMQPSHPRYLQLAEKHPWDTPLSPGYQKQCQAKAEKLPVGMLVGAVFVSPFTRCLQTAAAVLPSLHLTDNCRIYMHR